MTTLCPRCGATNRGVAMFCARCNASLPVAVPEPSPDDDTQAMTMLFDRDAVERADDTMAPTLVLGAPRVRRVGIEHGLPNGTRIEGFRIIRPLGEGGFGIVYLAWDAALERHVAIKEYMPFSLALRDKDLFEVCLRTERDRETFDAGLRSFVNEARLLARFDHRALVKVFRFWEANRTAYMAMPFYEGPTLKTELQNRESPPDERQLRAWLDPLLDALALIHAEQCFHRDIAPDNILLTAAGPVLLDFGAARRVITDRTQVLTAVMKPGFAPIEQYGGAMLQGPWTDLYALAGVVHFAITGRPPVSSAARVVSDSQVPLAESHRGQYSDAFLRTIDAALAFRPEGRPQDAAQFRAAMGDGGSAVVATALAPAAGAGAMPVPMAARTVTTAPGAGMAPSEVTMTAMPATLTNDPMITMTAPTGSFAPAADLESPPSDAEPASRPRRAQLLAALLVVVVLSVAAAWFGRGGNQAATRETTAAPVTPAPTASEPATATSTPAAADAQSVAAPAPPSAPAPTAAAPDAPATTVGTPSAAPAIAPAPAIAGVPEENPRPTPAAAPARTHAAAAAPAGHAIPAPAPERATAPRVVAKASPPAVEAGPKPRPQRCADIVQKSSLEPLKPDDVAYLKKECR